MFRPIANFTWSLALKVACTSHLIPHPQSFNGIWSQAEEKQPPCLSAKAKQAGEATTFPSAVGSLTSHLSCPGRCQQVLRESALTVRCQNPQTEGPYCPLLWVLQVLWGQLFTMYHSYAEGISRDGCRVPDWSLILPWLGYFDPQHPLSVIARSRLHQKADLHPSLGVLQVPPSAVIKYLSPH